VFFEFKLWSYGEYESCGTCEENFDVPKNKILEHNLASVLIVDFDNFKVVIQGPHWLIGLQLQIGASILLIGN